MVSYGGVGLELVYCSEIVIKVSHSASVFSFAIQHILSLFYYEK